MQHLIQKTVSTFQGKKVYLLGLDNEGKALWLVEPSWDCDHYWGFGYVEQFTSEDPQKAKDIIFHSHVNSELLCDKNNKDGSYCHNFFNSKIFSMTTFSEFEGWELSDLFQTFYTLKATASIFELGNSNLYGPKVNLKDEKLFEHINKELIPQVTNRIIEILSPQTQTQTQEPQNTTTTINKTIEIILTCPECRKKR